MSRLTLATLTVSILGLGCGGTGSAQAPDPIPSQAPGSAPLIVNILPGATGPLYSPDPAAIVAGRSIQWSNYDSVTHSATSDTGAFDTGPIQPKTTSSPIPFPSVGTFHYSSSDSPTLAGTVEVSPSPSPSPQASPAPSPSGSGSAATYTQVRAQVFQPKCVQCHSGANPPAGIDLSTYNGARAVVTPGNPATSRLYVAIQNGVMPPSGKLSQTDIDLVGSWIQNGALNN